MKKGTVMGFLVLALLLAMCFDGLAISQQQFCEGIGLNLSLVVDLNDCNTYWQMLNQTPTVTTNVTYQNFSTNNYFYYNNSATGNYYTKDEIDDLINEALEKKEFNDLKAELDQLKTAQQPKSDGSLETLIILQALSNLTTQKQEAQQPTTPENEPLSPDEIKKLMQDVIKQDRIANSGVVDSPTGSATKQTIIYDQPNIKKTYFGIEGKYWLIIAVVVFLIYLWRTGKLKQVLDRSPEKQHYREPDIDEIAETGLISQSTKKVKSKKKQRRK